MTREEWSEIHRLHDEGLSKRAIARRLGIHRRKVREAFESVHPRPKAGRKRGGIIDPHRGWMLAKLQLHPELSAARLHRMLCEQGFTGSYSLVKQTVADLRPRLKPVYRALTFAPGECAQVDWGVWKSVPVQGGVRRLSFFTMVLCRSRMLYAELCFGEALEFWLTAHRNAFEYFGGVPARVVVDNCKTAVIVPARHGCEPRFNEHYEAFARHYGFGIEACTPGRPNEKGRVEKGVGYVKSAFLAGRGPSPPPVLNPALRHWLDTAANVRIHRTTGKRPRELFDEEEKPQLKPLPPDPHDCAAVRFCVANSCCRVTVDANRYSIPPAFASQRLTLRLYADRVALFDKAGRFAADHPRCFDRGREIIDPAHAAALKFYTRRARDNRQLTAFLGLGTAAADYLAGLKEKRLDFMRHVRQINAQRAIFGRDAVARALLDAREHAAYAADYVLNLLHARSRIDGSADAPLSVPRHADLLELDIDEPDLDAYGIPEENEPDPKEKP